MWTFQNKMELIFNESSHEEFCYLLNTYFNMEDIKNLYILEQVIVFWKSVVKTSLGIMIVKKRVVILELIEFCLKILL